MEASAACRLFEKQYAVSGSNKKANARGALQQASPLSFRTCLLHNGGKQFSSHARTQAAFFQFRKYIQQSPRQPQGVLLGPNHLNKKRLHRRVHASFRSTGGEQEAGHLFCFGYGYTTLGLANSLVKQGWQVTGTCRSEEKREALNAQGLSTVIFDTDGDIEGLESDGLAALRDATHLVCSIPPVGDFDQDPALALQAAQIREAASHRLKWIGYLSTTGVYGNWDGAWVDESTVPQPSNARAAARLRAEEAWLSLGRECGVPVHVFRLGGIYGPSRSALDTVSSPRPASRNQRLRESRRFTSRCHVGDIVRSVVSAMKRPALGSRIYNVVDDDPAPRSEVVAYARQLLENPDSLTGSSREEGLRRVGSIEESSSPEKGTVESTGTEHELSTGSATLAEETVSLLQKRTDDADTGIKPMESRSIRSDSVAPVEGVSPDYTDSAGPKGQQNRGVDEKRVRNDRIKEELIGTLLFPTFREGLAAIASGDMQPFEKAGEPD